MLPLQLPLVPTVEMTYQDSREGLDRPFYVPPIIAGHHGWSLGYLW